VHENRYWDEDITPQQFYNMSDGWDQEEQSVKRLARAGVVIRNRQNRIFIGKSRVPGSYDGDFELNNLVCIWEHKAYDQQSDAVQTFMLHGIEGLPAQKTQTNAYMLGSGINHCCFHIKIKNNNTYMDTVYEIDRPFIEEIVEWCDRIRLDNWKPEPVKCRWCAKCGVGCFGEVLDFANITTMSESEAVKKWIEGKQLVGVGEMMQEEADAVLIGIRDKQGNFIQKGLIGDKDTLILPGMEIRRIVSHGMSVEKSLILSNFGPDGLMKVSVPYVRTQFRHFPKGD